MTPVWGVCREFPALKTVELASSRFSATGFSSGLLKKPSAVTSFSEFLSESLRQVILKGFIKDESSGARMLELAGLRPFLD